MIPRPTVINQIDRALGIHPIAALLGPRQCGKTTVARLFAERQPSTYFDLKNPVNDSTAARQDVDRAAGDPGQGDDRDGRLQQHQLWFSLRCAAISSMRCDRTTRMRSNTDNRMTTPLMT